MIGCMILGGLAAIGITKLMRCRYYGGCGGGRWGRRWGRGRWHGFHGHHRWGAPEWGGGGDEGWDQDVDAPDWPGGGGGGRSRFGQPFMMRGLFRRLETTPSQEDAIVAAWEAFRAEVGPL